MNPTFLEQESNYNQNKYTLNESKKSLMETDNMAYGGNNSPFGLGRIPCLLEGVKQIPWMVGEGFLLLKIESYAIKPVSVSWNMAKTSSKFTGSVKGDLYSYKLFKTDMAIRSANISGASSILSTSLKINDGVTLYNNMITNPVSKKPQ